MIREHLFSNRTELFNALTKNCLSFLTTALHNHGVASILASGGSTPAPLYERLSASDLNWGVIRVALVDERWVDRDHEASNESFLYRTLLKNKAELAVFTGMKNAASSAEEGYGEIERRYRSLPQPFTLAILGIGADGHTASWFPHAEGLAAAIASDDERLVTPIAARASRVTGLHTERMTLTLAGLLRSERLILLLTGDEKLAVYRHAQSTGSIEDMPVRALLQQERVPLELYWSP